MAYVKVMSRANQFVRVFYGVDGIVGRHGANRTDDVYLVQFFLNALWGETVEGRIVGSGNAPAIDGVCGKRTIEAIEGFQDYFLRGQSSFVIDGRIEPLPSNTLFGPRHGNPYTIIGLNANYGIAFGIDRHTTLPSEAKFPASLRSKLMLMN